MALSSRLAVAGRISGQISGIIRLDIRYYMAGYPVRQLAGYPAGYPNPALKNCRISGIQLSGFGSISRISGYPAKSLSGTSLEIIFKHIDYQIVQLLTQNILN